MANNFQDWNHRTSYVAPDDMLDNGQFGNYVQSESAFLFAGPPSGQDIQLDQLVGIGRAVAFQMSQSKQVQPNFEIGSKKKYFIPGYSMTQGTISQVMFNGPTLMKALKVIDGTDGTDQNGNDGDYAGYGNHWINLASNIFNRPIALGVILVDSEYNSTDSDSGNILGGFIIPNTFITSHSFALQAGMLVISENVSFMADEVKPLDIATLNS